jgi:hypothetical protein
MTERCEMCLDYIDDEEANNYYDKTLCNDCYRDETEDNP